MQDRRGTPRPNAQDLNHEAFGLWRALVNASPSSVSPLACSDPPITLHKPSIPRIMMAGAHWTRESEKPRKYRGFSPLVVVLARRKKPSGWTQNPVLARGCGFKSHLRQKREVRQTRGGTCLATCKSWRPSGPQLGRQLSPSEIWTYGEKPRWRPTGRQFQDRSLGLPNLSCAALRAGWRVLCATHFWPGFTPVYV